MRLLILWWYKSKKIKSGKPLKVLALGPGSKKEPGLFY
jgi:hypothetical protein